MVYRGGHDVADWRIVADETAEQAACADGYARFGAAPAEDLRTKAKRLGIKLDGRWSDERIRAEIEKVDA